MKIWSDLTFWPKTEPIWILKPYSLLFHTSDQFSLSLSLPLCFDKGMTNLNSFFYLFVLYLIVVVLSFSVIVVLYIKICIKKLLLKFVHLRKIRNLFAYWLLLYYEVTSNILVLTHGYSDCLLFKRVWFSF